MAQVEAMAVKEQGRTHSSSPVFEETNVLRLLSKPSFHADHDAGTQTAKFPANWMGEHET